MVTTGTELPVCANAADVSASNKQNAAKNPFASEAGRIVFMRQSLSFYYVSMADVTVTSKPLVAGKVKGAAGDSRAGFLTEQLVHLAEAVGQDFHDVGGEERVQLDEMEEPALVNLREPGGFAGDDGCVAR